MGKTLVIKQNTQLRENVSSAVIDKLYNLAYENQSLNIDPEVTSGANDIVGWIKPTAAYADAVAFLTAKFPNLTIDIAPNDCYIRFADNEVKNVLLSKGLGDGIGITKGQATNIVDLGTSYSTSYFRGNTSIETFDELGQFGVRTLYGAAFQDCTNLRSIDLSKITNINAGAFLRCSSLAIELNCPYLQTIGENSFQESGITKIVDLGQLSSIVGHPINGGMGAFRQCTSLTEVTLPTTLTSIGRSAFSGCSALTTLNGFDFSNITHIGSSAFEGCISLSLDVVNLPLIQTGTSKIFAQVTVNHIYVPNLTDGYASGYWGNYVYHDGFLAGNKNTASPINIVYLKNIERLYPGDFGHAIIRKLVINNTTPPAWCNQNNKNDNDPDIVDHADFQKNKVFGDTKIDGTPSTHMVQAIYVPDSAVSAYTSHQYWGQASVIIHPISELTVKTKSQWDELSDADKAITLISDYM